jgi:hypothetical protein
MSLPRASTVSLFNCFQNRFHFLTALKNLNCRVASLEFPCGRETPLIGIVIDSFTPIGHPKYADIVTVDLDKEL